jgi:uncharacterized protein (DUF302 family)
MKNFVSLIALVLATVVLAGCSVSDMMIDEKKSPYDFDKTVATIQENAMKRDWLVAKVYDFQKSLLKHKQPDPGRIKVLKLCHPEIAGKMLANDENKHVSVMMPCTISVYEKKDGNTYVAMMNMSLMSKVMGGEIGAILKRVAEEDAALLAFLEH